ncbi:hypothetical protein KBZ94_27160 [Streptomyces sp. RM72]|uniref:hypothetical protein n=1 Tax=Streptomyces sp. RM72 TaxID=1115510 RepID=UPI001B358A2C|nr:hypothetical protein [Streptomyces sp. RM72]MBQ0888556.1 hypothetical protein [Streptomyces sp. RM72]
MPKHTLNGGLVPTYLDNPHEYEPSGPDGQGWNRLSLNAHFDTPAHCGLRPIRFASLFEARTGRQRWGGYERCMGAKLVSRPVPDVSPDTPRIRCGTCPVYQNAREHPPVPNWPEQSVLLLGRVRDWPRTPGMWIADPAAGRSSVHLHTWQGQDTGVAVDWPDLAVAAEIRMTWQFHDQDGDAFWIVRLNPGAEQTAVHTKNFRDHTRHVLYAPGARRLAGVKCHGTCAHEDWHLHHLAADLADLDGATPTGGPAAAPDLPERLPGVPSFSLSRDGGTATITHTASRDFDASTMTVNAEVPTSPGVTAVLLAHIARVAAW